MRMRVRALIIQDGNILLIHRVRDGKEYWVFPGGGIEESDITPQQALKRECFEELGVTVDVGDLFVQNSFESPLGKQKELYYICKIISGKVGTGDGPESTRDPQIYGTYKNEWLSLSSISTKNLQPTEVRDKVVSDLS